MKENEEEEELVEEEDDEAKQYTQGTSQILYFKRCVHSNHY